MEECRVKGQGTQYPGSSEDRILESSRIGTAFFPEIIHRDGQQNRSRL